MRDPAACAALIEQTPTGAFIIVALDGYWAPGWRVFATRPGRQGVGRWGSWRRPLARNRDQSVHDRSPGLVVLAALVVIPLATWGGIRAARTPRINDDSARAA